METQTVEKAQMLDNQVDLLVMYVYSGNCRLCECGKPTGIKDDTNRELKTGDIVMSYTVDSFGVSNLLFGSVVITAG